MRITLIICCFLYGLTNTVFAYETEEKVKVVLIGKVAKFITWDSSPKTHFVITILNDPFNKLFDTIYQNRTIKKQRVKINYIENIDELEYSNILYIPKVNTETLNAIVSKIKNKNILTVSDMKGFASKGGIIQIYFASQKPKLKINLESANAGNLKIKSSLLRIVEVIKGDG